jgi:endoglucanase
MCLAACGSSHPAGGDAQRSPDTRLGDGRPDAPARRLPYRGTNLSGAEFGGQNLPGTFGTDYIYPDPNYATGYTSADYFLGKGMTTFRLPILWERLQRTLNQPFDTTELARLDQTIGDLTGKGAYVILDPHNSARYNGALVGSSGVPDSAFADFWSRAAAHFATNDHVIFGLTNEPHDMPTEQWANGANAALAAIRAAGASNLVLVPGNAYTGAWCWSQNFYGTANATVMLTITDPGDNMAFEVHQYLDSDYSGTHTPCQSTTIGADSLAGFTAWLKANGKRGMLGEFGGGANTTCYSAIDGMLAHIDANSDVYLGWAWWSAGPWWGNYFLSLEPVSGGDAPQMATLAAHLGP